ncbi:MAG: hypothetical protein JRG91_19070, partial [Deltaproteobacteria bacterium]|nr:hypothetical protein [Deltaproteobacteria bacterium]
AYRDPPEVPPDDGDPSGGTLHLTGVRDGTLRIAMGDAPGRPIDRHYRVFVPKAYDPDRSTPLVIMMPGHRVSHYGLASYTNLYRTADQNNFIVVDAEQQFRGTGERRWAWFTDWDWAGETDRSRVFLAGHSRGAAMAYIAALEMPDLIAGSIVQSGFTEFGYLDHRAQAPWTARRVPMVIMHGINDPDVPVRMGDEIVQRLRDLGWVEGEDFVYHRLANVPHRWQHWLNQEWYDFLHARPLPEGG